MLNSCDLKLTFLTEANSQKSNPKSLAMDVLLRTQIKCHFELFSFELENKEKDLTAALQELQTERLRETELRGLLEEQQFQHKKTEDENKKALEVMPCILTSCTKEVNERIFALFFVSNVFVQ